MKVVYIAGRYSDPRGEFYIRENIRYAEDAAIFVWKHGGIALCPHKNCAFFGGLLPYENFLNGSIELMKRCDAVWFITGWTQSKGACKEYTEAQQLSMRIFYTRGDIKTYLEEQ